MRPGLLQPQYTSDSAETILEAVLVGRIDGVGWKQPERTIMSTAPPLTDQRLVAPQARAVAAGADAAFILRARENHNGGRRG